MSAVAFKERYNIKKSTCSLLAPSPFVQGSGDPVEAVSAIFWGLEDLSIQRKMEYFDTLGTVEHGCGTILVIIVGFYLIFSTFP